MVRSGRIRRPRFKTTAGKGLGAIRSGPRPGLRDETEWGARLSRPPMILPLLCWLSAALPPPEESIVELVADVPARTALLGHLDSAVARSARRLSTRTGTSAAVIARALR